MNTNHQLFTICLLAFTALMPPTVSKAIDDLGYVLAPLHTQVHRSEISSNASAMLVVNPSAFIMDGDSELQRDRFAKLAKDLRILTAKNKDLLLIRIQNCSGQQLPKEAVTRLKEQLKLLATECDYASSQFTEFWTSADWQNGMGALGTGLLDDVGDEQVFINKTLVTAALKTRISKLHVGMGDVLVKIRRPFDGRNREITDETKKAIRQSLQSLDVEQRNCIVFHVLSTKDGADAVDALFSNSQPSAIPDNVPKALRELLLKEAEGFKYSPALQLARELGFKEIAYAHSSSSGAPERLLDAQAPSFDLQDLDGNWIKMPEWRSGKPALITFWGVACGPCRLEAPHLSRLQDKYGSRIAILAINAYSESEETIRDYVTSEKLTHSIAIGGKELAKSTYFVGSFPTTFWINRRGEVVRYVIGFENGEALENELIEFLDEDQSK